MASVSLTNWVVGALNPTPIITWYQDDDTIQDLTNVSSISGVMRNRTDGSTKAVAGTLAVYDASAGQFSWTLASGDVDTAGDWEVQFTANYSSGVSPAVTYLAQWQITEAISV